MWQKDFLLGKVGRRKVDRHALGRQRQAGSVQGCLHPLAAFRDRLVRKPDDLDPHFPGSDHDLDLDRNTFNALKCNRTDARDHAPAP